MSLALSLAIARNPRVGPLLDGKVTVDGVELTVHELRTAEIGRRQFTSAEFDVAELSLSFYLQALDRGIDSLIAIPVFVSRAFHHVKLVAAKKAGIRTPADLRGKRIGINEYNGTLDVWLRGALQHEFGISQEDVSWRIAQTNKTSLSKILGIPEPAGVDTTRGTAGSSVQDLLLAGEVDACLFDMRSAHAAVGQQETFADNVQPLFPDSRQEAIRYYAKTGLFPINHLVVVRRSLAEEHPWLAQRLCDAFEESKRESYRQLWSALEPFEWTCACERGELGDVMPYGLDANRTVLDAFLDYMHEQRILARRPDCAELFAAQGSHGRC